MTRRVADDPIVSRWRAAASPGGLIGILATLLSLLLAGGAVLVLSGRVDLPVHDLIVATALSVGLVAAVVLIYLLYGYATISYEYTDRDLIIRWAHRRWAIPLGSIQQILPAADRLQEHPGRWQRFWPGYYVGTERDPTGRVDVVATLPLHRQLLVRTHDRQFAISPERPVLFVEEYGRLVQMQSWMSARGDSPSAPRSCSSADLPTAGAPSARSGAAESVADDLPLPKAAGAESGGRRVGPSLTAWPSDSAAGRNVSPLLRPVLLNDGMALTLLAAAVVLNALMVTFILVQYESLPQSIVLHWNVNGDPDRIGSPREIWVLPIITSLVTLANFGLAWSIVTFDRFAARFLLAATCLVQLVAWTALLTLIR